MRHTWLSSAAVGVIIFVALMLVPESINGTARAAIAAAIGFLASIIVKAVRNA